MFRGGLFYSKSARKLKISPSLLYFDNKMIIHLQVRAAKIDTNQSQSTTYTHENRRKSGGI